MTIIFFLTILPGFATVGGGHTVEPAAAFVSVVLEGSEGWWIGLGVMFGAVRHRLNDKHLLAINRISGGLITLFGAILLLYLPSIHNGMV